MTSYLQLRESDLFARRGRIAQLSFFFCEEVFRAVAHEDRRSIDRCYRAHHTNEVERTNILAPGLKKLRF